MKIISEYNVLIDRDRKVNFILDSKDEFKSYGVSLFNISISRLYGDNNYLTKNKECINYLKRIISQQPSKIINDEVVYDFMWQHEMQIEFIADAVYIEKWGLCTKIKIEEFLNIFEEIQLFLNRWSDKNKFIDQVKDVFKNKKMEEARSLGYLKRPSENKIDHIQIMLSKDDLEIEVNEFLKSIIYPKHMV